MKIRLMVSEEKYAEIYKQLTAKGFEIDDGADLILSEKNVYVKYLIGRRGEEMFRLDVKNVTHIESFAHDIIAYSGGEEYKLSERLRRLEEILDPKDFIRVSNSAIVAVSHIKSIRPAFTQKFLLTMTDGSKVDVTRTYYYIFKEFLGI
ncbi:LytTR family DNA-binding domain-containing protein [Ruminococcus sp.]|uniref:LytTR family DNA-binding domain-containing protein n=1 Tax=Ruminococcus sp. TaxID=41978 RepID=UPI0025CF5C4E|nr:LytTR family DNA-binding domain-containing protein [Ruminococcus sp.]MBQ8966876.1 LytTR family transcriptional regulator [Ruminococcus sp.]